MSSFLINPDWISFSDARDIDDPALQQVAYCGVEISGLVVYAPHLVMSTERELAAGWLRDHLEGLSAHERLALIGKFLDARHDA